MYKVASLILLIFFIPFANAEYAIELTSDKVATVRIHTSHHGNISARKMALVQISGLNDGCNSGVFFDATDNQETLSFVLSAFVATINIRLGYEPNIRAPWGDTNYCALTYFDVK